MKDICFYVLCILYIVVPICVLVHGIYFKGEYDS